MQMMQSAMLKGFGTMQGLPAAEKTFEADLAHVALSGLRKHDQLARCDMRQPYAHAALTIMLRRAVILSGDSLKLLQRYVSLGLPKALVWPPGEQKNR